MPSRYRRVSSSATASAVGRSRLTFAITWLHASRTWEKPGWRVPDPIASWGVKVTMMLCDAAQVADGKLYILGGGWSMTGPDPVPSAIALKIDVGWHEAEEPHHWELYLEDADGQPVLVTTPEGDHPIEVRGEFTVGRPAGIPEGSPIDVALAVNLGPLPLTPGTRYTWRISIDGNSETDWMLGFTSRPARPES